MPHRKTMKTLLTLLVITASVAFANNPANDPIANALTQLYTSSINSNGLPTVTIESVVNSLINGIGMSNAGEGRRTLEMIGIIIATLGLLLALYRYNLGIQVNIPATLVTYVLALTLANATFADNGRNGFISTTIHSVHKQANRLAAANFEKSVEPQLRAFLAESQKVIVQASTLTMQLALANGSLTFLSDFISGGSLGKVIGAVRTIRGAQNAGVNGQALKDLISAANTQSGKAVTDSLSAGISRFTDSFKGLADTINNVIRQVMNIVMVYTQSLGIITIVLAVCIMLFPVAAGFLMFSNKPMFGIIGTSGTALLMCYFLPGTVAVGLQYATERPIQSMQAALASYDAIKKDLIENQALYRKIGNTETTIEKVEQCYNLHIQIKTIQQNTPNNYTTNPTYNKLLRDYSNNCGPNERAIVQTTGLETNFDWATEQLIGIGTTVTLELGSFFIRPAIGLATIGSALFLSGALMLLLLLIMPLVISSVIGGIQGIFRPS